MTRRQEYRSTLRALSRAEWAAHLRDHSGLPGPRANIELAQATADEGTAADFDALIDTGEEYLLFCGVVGLGRLAAGGAGADVEKRLRLHATDARWRVREAVAMALQRLGDANLPRLLDLADTWAADPDPLVQRAAVAGVCEPRLLREPDTGAAAYALGLCQRVTDTLAARPAGERRDTGVRALRQALGYCWSVAVAADPAHGLPRFRALEHHSDPDARWVARENAKKTRLARLL
jgi:hypothetical protein